VQGVSSANLAFGREFDARFSFGAAIVVLGSVLGCNPYSGD